MTRKWEYAVVEPRLPQAEDRRLSQRESPMMDHFEMESWLNLMDEQGWEFVGYGQKTWLPSGTIQNWWIFRRPFKSRGSPRSTSG